MQLARIILIWRKWEILLLVFWYKPWIPIILPFLYNPKCQMSSAHTHAHAHFLLNAFEMWTNQRSEVSFSLSHLVVHKWEAWWVKHFVPQKPFDDEHTGKTWRPGHASHTDSGDGRSFTEWITEQADGLWEADPGYLSFLTTEMSQRGKYPHYNSWQQTAVNFKAVTVFFFILFSAWSHLLISPSLSLRKVWRPDAIGLPKMILVRYVSNLKFSHWKCS
jgi:hypothetical protein